MAFVANATEKELELKEHIMAETEKFIGFRPNGYKIMARRPRMMDAIYQLLESIYEKSTIDQDSKQLVAYMTSYVNGCRFCQAHTSYWFAERPEKIQNVWEFATSDQYSDREKAMLRFTQIAALQPSGVGEEEYSDIRNYFTEDEILEIVSIIATFSFLNKWNDTLGTTLEPMLREFGEQTLGKSGWTAGKHG